MENYDESFELLDEAIQKGFGGLDPEKESYQDDVAALVKLYGARNEAERLICENNKIEYDRQAKVEEDLRVNKQRKLDIAKLVVSGVTAVGTAAIGIFEFVKMMNFETEGGFFKGFAGKQFSKEKRKEKEL